MTWLVPTLFLTGLVSFLGGAIRLSLAKRKFSAVWGVVPMIIGTALMASAMVVDLISTESAEASVTSFTLKDGSVIDVEITEENGKLVLRKVAGD